MSNNLPHNSELQVLGVITSHFETIRKYYDVDIVPPRSDYVKTEGSSHTSKAN